MKHHKFEIFNVHAAAVNLAIEKLQLLPVRDREVMAIRWSPADEKFQVYLKGATLNGFLAEIRPALVAHFGSVDTDEDIGGEDSVIGGTHATGLGETGSKGD